MKGYQKYACVELIEKDQVFGELGLLEGIKRAAATPAVGETVVGLIDRASLDAEFNRLSSGFWAIIKAKWNDIKSYWTDCQENRLSLIISNHPANGDLNDAYWRYSSGQVKFLLVL